MSKRASGKTIAKLVAVFGFLLIAAAGMLTAKEHFQRSGASCTPAARQAPTVLGDKLQVVDVSSAGAPGTPVAALGKQLCVTVVNVRSAAELDAAKAEVAASKAARDETMAELRKSRTELRTLTGEARKAIDTRTKDLTTQQTQEADAFNKAIQARDALMADVQLALFIDGKRTPARATVEATAEPAQVLFDLKQSWDARSEDAAVWRELLSGVPKGGKRDVTIGVGAPDAARPGATWQATGGVARKAELRVFQPTIAILAGLGFLLLLGAIFVAARETTLLRDGTDVASPYSLGRAQMAFWTVATVFGFTFIWVLTGQYVNVITTATFTLLGISGATALAATAIEGAPTDAKSKSFFTDILSDGSGALQLHRIQVGIWTLVFGAIYVWNVFDALILTEFDANMLLLLGIANGVYAGFKTQEVS